MGWIAIQTSAVVVESVERVQAILGRVRKTARVAFPSPCFTHAFIDKPDVHRRHDFAKIKQ